MGLIDTHCHLNLPVFHDDLGQVIEQAQEAGVTGIMVPSVDIENGREAIDLAGKYSILRAAVGIHPNDALKWNESSEEELLELARHPKVRAIGEIGLDYYRDWAPPALQREVLSNQLALAARLNLPVIIHNREAEEDLWPMLSEWQNQLNSNGHPLAERPGVLHSFSGPLTLARQAIAQNFYIGISGPVTFKNATVLRTWVAELPLERLLIETDAPYLTPHPHRGQRNEPAYVKWVAHKIAELHHMDPSRVMDITEHNAQHLFQWEHVD